jgi:hypothetical protein
MPIFEVGESEVGGEDTLGGTTSFVTPPDPEVPDPPEEPPVITLPTTPPEWAFLDNYQPPLVDYTFVVGTTGPAFVLANILQPALNFNLKDGCDVSFRLNQLDPIATQITEMLTDLWVYRDNDFIFRGRVGPSNDSLDAAGGYVDFSAVDYRHRAKRWFIYDDDIYFWFDEDVSVIAGDVLDIVQGRTGASYGVTEGIGFPTLGVVRNEVEFTPGTSMAAGLDSLQESKVRGFDWEISPELELNIWAQRGITPAVKQLEYRGAMSGLTRAYKTEEFANAARASGGEIPAPEIIEAASVGTDPRGRWEAEVSWPDAETQEVMNDRLEYLLEQVNRVPEEYSVDLVEGHWKGRSHLWLGDEVIMPINFGRLSVSPTVRVHSVNITPDGNGGEKVKMVMK